MLIFRFNPNRAIYYWLFSHSKIVRYVKLWLDFKIYEAPRWLFSKPILEYVSAVDSCKPVNRQKKLTCRLFPSLKILKWIFSTFTIAASHYAILKINFFPSTKHYDLNNIFTKNMFNVIYIYMIYYCQNWSFQNPKLKLLENIRKSGNLLSKKYKGSFFIVWLFYLALIAKQR